MLYCLLTQAAQLIDDTSQYSSLHNDDCTIYRWRADSSRNALPLSVARYQIQLNATRRIGDGTSTWAVLQHRPIGTLALVPLCTSLSGCLVLAANGRVFHCAYPHWWFYYRWGGDFCRWRRCRRRRRHIPHRTVGATLACAVARIGIPQICFKYETEPHELREFATHRRVHRRADTVWFGRWSWHTVGEDAMLGAHSTTAASQ